MQLEPLDGTVTEASSNATLAGAAGGRRVRFDPDDDTTHSIEAAVDDAGVLGTISFGGDRRGADQVMGSLAVAPGQSRPAARQPSSARPSIATLAARRGPHSGPGFDTCAAPSTGSMQAWLGSPFQAIGIYIGGANRACPDGNLSRAWVRAVQGQGWGLIPIYVGLQAPCAGNFATIDPARAASQGARAADDAAKRARGFGLARGTAILFDMEAYSPTGGACSSAVTTFLAAWTGEVHRKGEVSGVYGSVGSTVADLVNSPNTRPDEIWFARWDGVATTEDPRIPAGAWPNHERIKQYQGGHDETFGGVTINIDSDVLDATL